LGIEETSWSEHLRTARNAQAAHLDALLRVNGPRYLRLQHLHENLKANGKADHIELNTDLGTEPTLWLDMAHRVRMEPDAKTYRLVHMGETMQTLLETQDVHAMQNASATVLAHAEVKRAAKPEMAKNTSYLSFATLGYVWLTGVITGAALWALAVIYL
jgi:hypothetical protein